MYTGRWVVLLFFWHRMDFEEEGGFLKTLKRTTERKSPKCVALGQTHVHKNML